MAKIVKVRKDSNTGELVAFKLDNGKELKFFDCYSAIERGEIEGVMATVGHSGAPIIRSLPDGNPSNNLSNLPTF